MTIGLTGSYCAGKNHVANLLHTRGFEVLDVDRLGHTALELEKTAIVAMFGEAILADDGLINRRKLGERVFSNPEELRNLEKIIHPAVNKLTEDWLAAHEGHDLVVNAALLHRSTVFERLDMIILVRAPFITRLCRARKRDKLPFLDLIKRFASQKDFNSQYFQKRADIHYIDNRGSFGPFHTFRARGLERRLDSVLARKGMDR
jgi:dephospho-CoA kinase